MFFQNNSNLQHVTWRLQEVLEAASGNKGTHSYSFIRTVDPEGKRETVCLLDGKEVSLKEFSYAIQGEVQADAEVEFLSSLFSKSQSSST